MEPSDALKKAINDYRSTPESDQQNTSRIDSAYWAFISDSFAECVRYKQDLHAVIAGMKDLIDFGLCPEMLENCEEVKDRILPKESPDGVLKINLLSSFIEEHLSTILQESSRERIEKEIDLAEMEKSRFEREIAGLRENRRQLLQSAFGCSSKSISIAAQMEAIDELQRSSLEMKKNVGRGTFMSVEKKREHFVREKSILDKQSKIDRFIVSDPDQKEAAEQIKQQTREILQTVQKVIDLDLSIAGMREDIERIEREQRSISGLELENRIRLEIDYLKDLVRLSARRIHASSCPLLRKDDTFFTFDELGRCLERVMEFDPRVFQNERTVHFGKPNILLIPGNGNALYDWKHNQIVVPLVPYQKNFIASIASGIIEYRFDTDEDKKLLHSFNQLPENKTIKSVVQLKTKLIKEYTLWMTSEYTGFRVLSTLSKKWFEREIAPDRTAIFTPFRYQTFELPAAEFQRPLKKVEGELQDRRNAPLETLWTASILQYQQGKIDKAYEFCSELIRRDPDRVFAWYNLGVIAAKVMRKSEAIEAFNQFIKRRSQSWWTAVAYDQVRQLQIG
ncbi:MAG: tetratricopeptide repeat protein [Chitinispirillaceae bacterium]|nr:tetratricopeptide repeat protein [Chitinispirillaceae bacterium]